MKSTPALQPDYRRRGQDLRRTAGLVDRVHPEHAQGRRVCPGVNVIKVIKELI
jgi:hypothetical protein